mmetsp:Transcript_19228/g.29290  ORF Transcript_19228/g.29290 Transcript_19228/m.29290 type:complete len:975 (+) Transcript_19228:165-3089(+)
MDSKDEKFQARILSSIATVEAWDADPLLLQECRLMIPFKSLVTDTESQEGSNPYVREDDFLYSGNALFLKRLAVFFQKDVMTWVNQPPCSACGGSDMEFKETRGPQSEEEREGQAQRVEVYSCKSCSNGSTTFPRYNSVRKLLESRRGRCGEYANLFGLYCRSAGFETRYVSDWTDHVWVEALIGDEWIMADSCEGTINKPAMYESGWGKKLNYIVGISRHEVVDVTLRYTRNFQQDDFQGRRREITSTEQAGELVIQKCNQTLRKDLSKPREEEINHRLQREREILDSFKALLEFTDSERHGHGRISGSLEWKVSRNEEGKTKQEESMDSVVRALEVEQFYPVGSTEICIFPRNQEGIIVGGANCDIGRPGCISLVVIDDAYLGCVLFCRSYTALEELSKFVTTIPSNKIVVLKGKTANIDEEVTQTMKQRMSLLGGFQFPEDLNEGIIFVGQIEAHPKWTLCTSYENCQHFGFFLTFPPKSRVPQKLRTEPKTMPKQVAMRLPDSIMPLHSQLLATEDEKRSAFLAFSKTNPSFVGYTTKKSNPLYLLNNSSFPFQKVNSREWNTFQFLPDALVPSNDEGVSQHRSSSKFDIPVDENFFSSLLGPDLAASSGSSEPVKKRLQNTRLVGLYFSAHWCGPCRRFTPILSEFYDHLKDIFPFHGLEIVFVSSDRSSSEFKGYYQSMPWTAVAFDETRQRQQEISIKYGVRGIPALIILDSISGQIVVSSAQSRTDVMKACQTGEPGIEEMFRQWLTLIPEESKELHTLLELSCESDEENEALPQSRKFDYLVRDGEPKVPQCNKENVERKVKELFTTLVKNGENPNTAAAKAIKLVGLQQQKGLPYEIGNLTDGSLRKLTEKKYNARSEALVKLKERNESSKDIAVKILKTMLKYIENALNEPWNPRFRAFKLNNKVADRATRFEGSLDYICSFGMDVIPTNQDFMIILPVAEDLDAMKNAVIDDLGKMEKDASP